MYDQFLYSVSHSDGVFAGKYPNDYILMTWHRQENTLSRDRMEKMLSFIERIEYKIIFPIHPRTKKMLEECGLWERVDNNKNIMVTEPVGYKEMTALLSGCRLLVSDSGGASKEVSFVGKKCFFPLKLDVWPELRRLGYINIVDIEDEKSVRHNIQKIRELLQSGGDMARPDCFGNGNAAEIIADTIQEVLGIKGI